MTPYREGPPPDLVIFDCNGVLVDSKRAATRAMADLMAELGHRMSFDEAADHFVGSSPAQCAAAIRDVLGYEPPNLIERIVAATSGALEQGAPAVPGVDAVLATLRRPSCVATNGTRSKTLVSLERVGLRTRFEGRVFCAEDLATPKAARAAPELLLHAARACGAAPPRCIVVEDMPAGVLAARAAGMKVLAYAGLTPADWLHAAGAHRVVHAMVDLSRHLVLDR